MVAMDFFEVSNYYDFFNQYFLNLLKNPTVRGLIKSQSNKIVELAMLQKEKNSFLPVLARVASRGSTIGKGWKKLVILYHCLVVYTFRSSVLTLYYSLLGKA